MEKTFELGEKQNQYPPSYSNALELEREGCGGNRISPYLNLPLTERARAYLKNRGLEFLILLLFPF